MHALVKHICESILQHSFFCREFTDCAIGEFGAQGAVRVSPENADVPQVVTPN